MRKKKTRRTFTPEYRHDAASIVIDQNLTIASVARDLGVGEALLDRWSSMSENDASRSVLASQRLKNYMPRLPGCVRKMFGLPWKMNSWKKQAPSSQPSNTGATV
ncbi:transposase [Arcanobacterium canis]